MAKHLPTHLKTTGYNICLVATTSATIKTRDYNIYLVVTTSTTNEATMAITSAKASQSCPK